MTHPHFETVTLDNIVGGGQALGSLENGQKVFVWGGLPRERVEVQITKKKKYFLEGMVTHVEQASPDRITPKDPESYLSTSPWQIMSFDAEQRYKAALIEEAFELHDIVLPEPIAIFTNATVFGYRNKVEFSWWWEKDTDQLDLAFFRRGTHGKIPVDGTSLAPPCINEAARRLRDLLRGRHTPAFDLKTAIIRCSQEGSVVIQLYIKEPAFPLLTKEEFTQLAVHGFELIFSNPKSPASVITRRLQTWGITTLHDTILHTAFTYAVEGFFQINLPVYEQALQDMREWVGKAESIIDLYSGVGTIGMSMGGSHVTMIESNEVAINEMRRNITALGRVTDLHAILAPSEKALEYITHDALVIVDPPRAGLHQAVIEKLLTEKPTRILYLSCNPVTQARDVARLSEAYGIRAHKGYNFFPRTPHIEHLVVLDLLS